VHISHKRCKAVDICRKGVVVAAGNFWCHIPSGPRQTRQSETVGSFRNDSRGPKSKICTQPRYQNQCSWV
jgi:hypothetical protein